MNKIKIECKANVKIQPKGVSVPISHDEFDAILDKYIESGIKKEKEKKNTK